MRYQAYISAIKNTYDVHNRHRVEIDANQKAKKYWDKTVPNYSGWSLEDNPLQNITNE